MYIISVVLGEKIKAAVYSKDYKQTAASEAAYSCTCKESALADAAKLVKAVMADNGIKAEDVEFIGAAIPESYGCPCCAASEIEKQTGIKTAAETVINAKALGEAYLAGDKSSLITLKIDETVESGIVIDKKIYAGFSHMGGRVAHMVIDFGGYDCTCGRKGCFEAYVSSAGVKKIAADNGVNAETIAELFAKDCSCANAAKTFYIEHLANAITDIINLFQPEELVLEGAFTKVGDPIMKPMMEIVLRDQYTRHSPNKCNVRFANTEADTALMGAALIIR